MQNNDDALVHRLPAYVLETAEEKQAAAEQMGQAIAADIPERIEAEQEAIANWTDEQRDLAASVETPVVQD